MLKEQGKQVVLGEARLENREALFAEIDAVKPTHILDAAGVTGRCVCVCVGYGWVVVVLLMAVGSGRAACLACFVHPVHQHPC